MPAVFAPVLLGWRAGWLESLRRAVDAHMVEDLGDCVAVFDDRDDLAPAAALVALQNIDKKHPPEELGPAHSALLFLLGCAGAGWLLALAGRDDHLVSPASLGGKLSVVAQQVPPGKWYKCRNFSQKIERLKDLGGGAI